ncbi:MAG TPA: HYExAFE family protein [Phycisphaerae bacterium]|nr:HYExAFE family protein [Phycisphaerae bacterium]
MSAKRTHYELAFEAHLNRRGTPYVAVEDVRHFVKERTGLKGFDYIVYPAAGPACLVDVKGRKCRGLGDDGECRQKNWVTRADIAGLEAWQELFGPGYAAAFVFAYWLAGGGGPAQPPLNGSICEPVMSFAGRQYSFWIVSAADYARHHKRLSRRWDTVSVPRDAFRMISKPLVSIWPAAPC